MVDPAVVHGGGVVRKPVQREIEQQAKTLAAARGRGGGEGIEAGIGARVWDRPAGQQHMVESQ